MKPKKGKVCLFAEKKTNAQAKGKQSAESNTEDEFCGAFDNISDDRCYTDFNALVCHYQEEKQAAFLELDFSFQQGKWILIAFATKKIEKHYTGVIVCLIGEPTVKFTRRVKNTSMFI